MLHSFVLWKWITAPWSPQWQLVRPTLARWILGVITHKWTQLFPPCWELSWQTERERERRLRHRLAQLYDSTTSQWKSSSNSLFPMITVGIYHTLSAARGCASECACMDGGVSSPLVGEIFWKEMYFRAGRKRRTVQLFQHRRRKRRRGMAKSVNGYTELGIWHVLQCMLG